MGTTVNMPKGKQPDYNSATSLDTNNLDTKMFMLSEVNLFNVFKNVKIIQNGQWYLWQPSEDTK